MQIKLDRRTLLAAGAAFVASGGAAFAKANFAVPDGACDCHHHIYDPRFPYQPGAMLKPPPATVSDYRRQVQARLGTSRSITVTPSTYGTDNRCLIDALGQSGRASRGVAVCHPDIPLKDLKAMHAAGVRGVRIQFGRGLIVPAGEIEPLARRIQPLGWHMQFNMSAEEYAGIAPVLLRLPVPVVIDHFGHVPMPQGTASAHYKLIRRLLDSGNGWMKLSSPYTDSKTGAPAYADIAALARDYIAHAPDRMLWASNWPFPDVPGGNVDPLLMLNLLQAWSPDAKMRHRILVENPEALYGFDPKDRPKAL